MNKSKMLALVIGILILCEALGVIYFANKTYNLSRKNQAMAAKIESIQPGYARMTKESEESMAKSREAIAKYKEMEKELESVKADRENILAQTKNLLANRARVQELEDELGKVKASLRPVEDARKKEKEQNLVLKTQVRKLKDERAKLTAERDEIKSSYEKLQDNTLVKELNTRSARGAKERRRRGQCRKEQGRIGFESGGEKKFPVDARERQARRKQGTIGGQDRRAEDQLRGGVREK